MAKKHEIEVGGTAMLKVGRNEVQVKVLCQLAGGNAYMVKNVASGKKFTVPASRLAVPTVTTEPVEPKPESVPTKKMSLMDAAVAVLKENGAPMNTREMVKAATEKGYWTPTACKTPEQTLYGSIFREIKTKEQPRIVKSDVRGKFVIAG